MVLLIDYRYIEGGNYAGTSLYSVKTIPFMSQSNDEAPYGSNKRKITESELEDIEFMKRMRSSLSKNEMKVCNGSIRDTYVLTHNINIKALTCRVSERGIDIDGTQVAKVGTLMTLEDIYIYILILLCRIALSPL